MDESLKENYNLDFSSFPAPVPLYLLLVTLIYNEQLSSLCEYLNNSIYKFLVSHKSSNLIPDWLQVYLSIEHL